MEAGKAVDFSDFGPLSWRTLLGLLRLLSGALSLPVAAHRLPAGLAVLVWVAVRHNGNPAPAGEI